MLSGVPLGVLWSRGVVSPNTEASTPSAKRDLAKFQHPPHFESLAAATSGTSTPNYPSSKQPTQHRQHDQAYGFLLLRLRQSLIPIQAQRRSASPESTERGTAPRCASRSRRWRCAYSARSLYLDSECSYFSDHTTQPLRVSVVSSSSYQNNE